MTSSSGTSLDFDPLESKGKSIQADLESCDVVSTVPEQGHEDSALQKWTDDQFLKIGKFVVKRPWQVIAASLLFCLVLFAGVLTPNMSYESRSEYLWVPTDSLAYKSFQYNNKVFPQHYHQIILVRPEDKSDNFLTKQVFDAIWELDTRIRAVTTKDGTTFDEVCRAYDGECYVNSVLNYWDDYDDYNATVSSDADVVNAVSSLVDADGFYMPRSSYFGRYIENSTTGELIWAYGTNLVYYLDESKISASKSHEWELEFLEVCGVKGAPIDPVLKQRYDHISTYPLAYHTLDDEMTRVVTVDIPLVILEYVAMFVFVSIAVSYGQSETKTGQAIGCIMSVILSTMSAYGLCAAAGIPMTQLLFILPFILVGIGVDDGVVIISSFRQIPPATFADEEDGGVGSRVAKALGRCSLSIVYTTGTDVAAFSLGCLGTIPAVRYFCAYAAVAVALDFLFQVTFFVAIITIDERRSYRNNLAKFEKESYESCATPSVAAQAVPTSPLSSPDASTALTTSSSFPTSPTAPSRNQAGANNTDKSSLCARLCARRKKLSTADENAQRQKYALAYIKALTSPIGLVMVMFGFLGFAALCAWSATNLTNNFSVSLVIPDDSYAKDFLNEVSRIHLGIQDIISYSVVFKGSKTNIADPEVQANAGALLYDLAYDTSRSEGPVSFWLNDFLSWSANQTSYENYITSDGYFNGTASDQSETAFNSAVSEFLSVPPYNRYESSVILRSDGSVRAHEARLYHFNVKKADDKVRAMVAGYETCDKADGFSTKSATPYAQAYVFITGFLVIFDQTILNLLLSFVAVTLISIPVLQSYKAVFAVLICVAAIDVDLVGLIWLWGLNLNSLTMVALVMAIGLVVDYLAHILHYFMIHSNSPDPQVRMANALAEVGGAVAIGGLTTFIGVLPLAFASSFVYRVFFKLFLSIVVLGVVHGFVVAPVFMVLLFRCESKDQKEAGANDSPVITGKKVQPSQMPGATMMGVSGTSEQSL